MHTDLTVASVFAAETCADVVGSLFRYGGGRLARAVAAHAAPAA